MEANSNDYKPITSVHDDIRNAVFRSLGGECCCCGYNDFDGLVLVYTDFAYVVRTEKYTPKKGPNEYERLYKRRYPQNGRKLACRRCLIAAGGSDATYHFPNKCGFNHDDLEDELPRYASKEPHPAVLKEVSESFQRLYGTLPERDFRDYWKDPTESLRGDEAIMVEMFKRRWDNLYRRNRSRIRRRSNREGTREQPRRRTTVTPIEQNDFDELMRRASTQVTIPTSYQGTEAFFVQDEATGLQALFTAEELEELGRSDPDIAIVREMAAAEEEARRQAEETNGHTE